MLGNIPFTVPGAFADGVADGSIVRIGTLLKDASSGRILAHVQETGLAQKLVSAVGAKAFMPFRAADLASSVYANVQLAQLKAMVSGLQLLGFTTMGVAAAGLGVSVVGFVLLNKRLKDIENSISDLAKRMDAHFIELHQENLREHLANLGVLLERANQIPLRNNAGHAWVTTEEALALESGFFRTKLNDLLNKPAFDATWFQMLASALFMSDAARLQCLFNADEMKAAHHSASEISGHYCRLFDPVSVNTLTNKIMPTGAQDPENELASYRRCNRQAQLILGELREATDVALARPYLLEHLARRDISGPDFLATVNAISDEPIVLLTE